MDNNLVLIVHMDDIQTEETFDLNGVKYAQIKTNRKPVSSNLAAIVVKEIGLIQEKKSKLSRSERDRLIKIFENNFYCVTNQIQP